MLTLAIEQSTSLSSVALLDDTAVVAERNWNDSRSRDRRLFSVLPDIFREASVKPADIDTFAVGLGPGSFSGLRISLSAARGLAMPGKKRVFGVASGEALAWDILREKAATPIIVIGDARRDHLWFAQFNGTNDALKMQTPFSLIRTQKLPAALKKGSTVVTPDWERIGEKLMESASPGVTLIQEKRVPRARTVGELAFRKISESPEPSVHGVTKGLTPLYLHPPVAKEVPGRSTTKLGSGTFCMKKRI